MDILEKICIKNGFPYIRLENEIHFWTYNYWNYICVIHSKLERNNDLPVLKKEKKNKKEG